MIEKHSKYIIVGAGLSGLTTAYQLLRQGEGDFIILEGRDRIGGRIKTESTVDLGATWFQQYHSHLSHLMDELNNDRFEQYSKGKSILVYNSMAPAHYFESDSDLPSANRIADGSISLINKLSENAQDKIVLNTTVTDIIEDQNSIIIKTNNGSYTADKAVVTTPPRIATYINYSPALPNAMMDTMRSTHTWMSNAIKVGITYKTPFWRSQNLSGTLIGQIGPVRELYDHSNHSETAFSLMGFVSEELRNESEPDRKELILSHLEKYLSQEVREYTHYLEKDWSKDKYTCKKLEPLYMSPRYGNPLFQESFMNNKLIFSGAETSPVYGGYMEGAVYSGLNAAQLLRK